MSGTALEVMAQLNRLSLSLSSASLPMIERAPAICIYGEYGVHETVNLACRLSPANHLSIRSIMPNIGGDP